MGDIFFANNNLEISWNELLLNLSKKKKYRIFAHYKNTYLYFEHIILSLLIDKPVVLLDSDFTNAEINNLLENSSYINEEIEISPPKIISKNDLIEFVKFSNFSEWSITLFTSGTTGIPKKVIHSFKAITRNVKLSENHSNDIWGFAYNPTHMAGTQVFFQAFLNGNTIVELFNLTTEEISKLIKKYNVTHISATPTFYNLNFDESNIYKSVLNITLGGEIANKLIYQKVKKIFPNAKITNIYALTEAGSLLNSHNDEFQITDTNLFKIENNILFIHKSVLGNFEINDEWYNTGDVVEIVKKNPLTIKFVSREKELINVGGLKVNPYEVENALKQIDGIREAVVYAKKNSVLGNIICADVIVDKEMTEQIIREKLSKYLQEFKIPRIINFVNEIKLNRASKLQRL